MPYLSDAELGQLARRSPEPEREDSSSDAGSPVTALGSVLGMGTAGVVGFMRAKLGDANTGEWKIPGTNWDAEGVLFGSLAAVALFGKWVDIPADIRGYAAIGAFGVGSHYVGELGRQLGRTGQLSMSIGSGVPPWDPSSFDPTQFSDPHADEAARGLASSGV